MRNYYQILGISPDANEKEMKAAWIFNLKAFHPDKYACSSPEHQLIAQERALAINEAYAVLSDPVRKANHDRERSSYQKYFGNPEWWAARGTSEPSPDSPEPIAATSPPPEKKSGKKEHNPAENPCRGDSSDRRAEQPRGRKRRGGAKIFISAADSELKSARQRVADLLSSAGYQAVWEEITANDTIDSCAAIRNKIEGARAVVQLVGHSYGREPAKPDIQFGRTSYAQYEGLYAKQCGKKVFHLFVGEKFPFDCSGEENDTLRKLQSAYRNRLQLVDPHLFESIDDEAGLERAVLKLIETLNIARRRDRNHRLVGIAALLIVFAAVAAVLELPGNSWRFPSLTQDSAQDTDTSAPSPVRMEIDAMYGRAYQAFKANNFSEALRELSRLDGYEPDVAESQNLRGVIYMQQGIYDKAELALTKALGINPKFWGARFNLAEVPFLKKDWRQARERFERLSGSDAAEGTDESQLIQYKIFFTHLFEGRDNLADSLLANLKRDASALHYASATIGLHGKNPAEASGWISAAEKDFSASLNGPFAESLYRAGWFENEQSEGGPALELPAAGDVTARAKSLASSKVAEAQTAFHSGQLDAALRLVDQADAFDPAQPRTLNLRGEIWMERRDFYQAEAIFKKAAEIDPKLHEARYNLAQISFKRKEYGQARARFQVLYSEIAGADKDEAALLLFKIFMTYLLEDQASWASKMIEQFQFTGNTPALHYARAAWEFRQNNQANANEWITSANKLYAPALNAAFAEAFYDLGWLQRQAAPGSSAVAGREAASDSVSHGAVDAPNGSVLGIAEAATEENVDRNAETTQ